MYTHTHTRTHTRAHMINHQQRHQQPRRKNKSQELPNLLTQRFVCWFAAGDIKVEISNRKGELISKLPGSSAKKLLVELKVIWHCKCLGLCLKHLCVRVPVRHCVFVSLCRSHHVYLCVYVHACQTLCLCIFVLVFVSVSSCVSLCVCACVSDSVSFYLCVGLIMCVSVCVRVHLRLCMFVGLCVGLIMCVCVCVCVCISDSVCLLVFVSVSSCVSRCVCACASQTLYVSWSLCRSHHVYVRHAAWPHLYAYQSASVMTACLSVCLFELWSVYQSLCLSVCVSFLLFVHVFACICLCTHAPIKWQYACVYAHLCIDYL